MNSYKKVKSTSRISKFNIVPVEIPISEVLYSSHRTLKSCSPSVDIIGRKLSSDYIVTSNKEAESKHPLTIYTIPSKIINALSFKRASSHRKLKTRTEKTKEFAKPCKRKSLTKDSVPASSKSCPRLKKKVKKSEPEKNRVNRKSHKMQGIRKTLKFFVSKPLKF